MSNSYAQPILRTSDLSEGMRIVGRLLAIADLRGLEVDFEVRVTSADVLAPLTELFPNIRWWSEGDGDGWSDNGDDPFSHLPIRLRSWGRPPELVEPFLKAIGDSPATVRWDFMGWPAAPKWVWVRGCRGRLRDAVRTYPGSRPGRACGRSHGVRPHQAVRGRTRTVAGGPGRAAGDRRPGGGTLLRCPVNAVRPRRMFSAGAHGLGLVKPSFQGLKGARVVRGGRSDRSRPCPSPRSRPRRRSSAHSCWSGRKVPVIPRYRKHGREFSG